MIDTGKCSRITQVTLGGQLTLEEFVAIARYHAKVEFSEEYAARVNAGRKIVESWIEEKRVVYGTTTGFGQLCDKIISPEETKTLQEYLILSDCASVGDPLSEEQVRAIMLMILQNAGQGSAGCRLETLEVFRQFLNRGVTPWAPGDGSVGYLSVEAAIAYVALGGGKAYYNGELMEGAAALAAAGLEPIELSSKEGLVLISGTTSPTGLASLALYDMLQAVKSADIIGAFTLESLKGLIRAFDPRVMAVRPHPDQADTAENVRRILADSEVIEEAKDTHLQDALSLRCIPQQHGAAKNIFGMARKTVEIEMNSCCDNPILWSDGVTSEAISACNPDSSYVGMAMDSCGIAATSLAKMSERRSTRLIDKNMSGYNWYLTKDPGLSVGLMVPQYTQAGLLGEMRTLAYPASVDCTPTCGNQEDYVAMGYFACKKATELAEKLEYVLAVELLSDIVAQGFMETEAKRSAASAKVYEVLKEELALTGEDQVWSGPVEVLRDFIHSGKLIELVEGTTGGLK